MFRRIRSVNEWTTVRNTLTTRLAIVALALGVLAPSVSAADEVTDWNQILTSALTATSTSPQNAGRIAAITHAAVFDAVNGIDRRYTPYFVTDEAPRWASRRSAAVQAAYVVLKTLVPAQASGFERARDASIAAIRLDDRGVDRGIEWGQFVADTLLAERSTDGFPNGGVPDFGDTTVGKWRPQVAGMQAVTPWLAVLTPFAMPSPDHFRPAGPPALDQRDLYQRLRRSKDIGARHWLVTHARAGCHRLLLDGQHHLPLEPDRRLRRSPAAHHLVAERAAVRAAERRDGRCGHCRLGREIPVQVLAAVQRHSACRYRRQCVYRGRSGVDAAARDTESPGISVRPRRPQRGGGPRACPYLRRQNHVHPPD